MSDAKQENAEAPAAAPPAGGGGKATFIGGLFGVLLVIGGGVAIGIVGFPGKHHEPKEEHHDPMVDPEAKKPSAVMTVPQLIVNLSDTSGKHILQSQWSLEVTATDIAAASTKFSDWLPRVQDQMIKIISSKRSIDLEGQQNKDFLQTQIKDRLNESVFATEEAKVRGVYFTEFVIQ